MKIRIDQGERRKMIVLGKNHSKNSMCKSTEAGKIEDWCRQSTMSKEKR